MACTIGAAAYICSPLTADNAVEDSVAQLVEHNTFNVGVLGSSPSGVTRNKAVGP